MLPPFTVGRCLRRGGKQGGQCVVGNDSLAAIATKAMAASVSVGEEAYFPTRT